MVGPWPGEPVSSACPIKHPGSQSAYPGNVSCSLSADYCTEVKKYEQNAARHASIPVPTADVGNVMADPPNTQWTGFDAMVKDLWHIALCVVIFVMFSGCLPIPPRSISISDVPKTSDSSCTFTMVRDRQFVLALSTHYISLDGEFIASLDMSEYTTFSVPEGPHSLGVTWRVIDEDSIRFRVLAWKDLTESMDVICEPPMRYLFTTTGGLPWYPEETATVERVGGFEGEFSLDDKDFVSPGATQSN